MHYISEFLDGRVQLRSVDYFKVHLQKREGEGLGVCDVCATAASGMSELLPSFGLLCRSHNSRLQSGSCEEPGMASPD